MDETANKPPSADTSQVGDASARGRPTVQLDTASAPALGGAQKAGSPVTAAQGLATSTGTRQAEPPRYDYSLPEDYIQILRPCVDNLRLFLIDKEQIYDDSVDEFNLFTVIHNHWDYRCLITIPSDDLRKPSGTFLKSQKYFFELMLGKYRDRMKLFIIHTENPNAKYKTFLDAQVAIPMGLTIEYLPTSELLDIQGEILEVQVKNLKRMISLDDLIQPVPTDKTLRPPAGGPSGPIPPADTQPKGMPAGGKSFLKFDEKRELARIIEGISVFDTGSEAERKTFLEEIAGLEDVIAGMALKVETVVPAIIKKCEQFGELAERPGYHALGALLESVEYSGELSPIDGKKVYSLIMRYTLVTDPDRIKQLTDKYEPHDG